MPKPVIKAELKPVFTNPVLEDAVLWGLMQSNDTTEEQAKMIMQHIPAPRLLSMAAEHIFLEGYNPRAGRAAIVRDALIHLNKTGMLPT